MEVTENQIGELNEKEKLEMDINSCKSFVWLACVVYMVSGLSLIVLLCSFVVYPYFYINKQQYIYIIVGTKFPFFALMVTRRPTRRIIVLCVGRKSKLILSKLI